MKPHFKVIVAAMALALLGAPAIAAADSGQVYTWVDKNGVRHYSDQPANPKARAVNGLQTATPASSTGTPAPAGSTGAPARGNAPAPGSAARAGHKMTPRERAALCSQLQAQIKRLESARRVEVKKGNATKFLSGEELVLFRHKLEKREHKVCAPPGASSSSP